MGFEKLSNWPFDVSDEGGQARPSGRLFRWGGEALLEYAAMCKRSRAEEK